MNIYFSILLEELPSIQRDAGDIFPAFWKNGPLFREMLDTGDFGDIFSSLLEELSSIQRDACDIEDVISKYIQYLPNSFHR